MSRIKTSSDASASLVPADAVDWKHVVAVKLWSVRGDRNATQLRSESPNISLLDAAGVRYGLTVIFEDDPWIWIDMTADIEEAIRGIQRFRQSTTSLSGELATTSSGWRRASNGEGRQTRTDGAAGVPHAPAAK